MHNAHTYIVGHGEVVNADNEKGTLSAMNLNQYDPLQPKHKQIISRLLQIAQTLSGIRSARRTSGRKNDLRPSPTAIRRAHEPLKESLRTGVPGKGRRRVGRGKGCYEVMQLRR